jgi:4-diphosphocytidyl-2-C-methyl-D-erythritol kinase
VSETAARRARAKLNLFLRVFGREPDGFHHLETLFVRVELADSVSARKVEGKAVTLTVTGADTGPLEANLAVRAAQAVLGSLRTPFGVELTLEKQIPVGAGLGGGSADAAATLLLVNQLAGNAVPRAELLQMAARLGADVAFCLSEAPLALGWGRGERLMLLDPLPEAHLLLLHPPVHIATSEAYRWLDESRIQAQRRGAVLLDPASLSSWSDVARMAGNDFESVVFGHQPEVRAGFEALAKTGPLLCRMTGSGSTLFAVYRNEKERDDARMTLGRKYGAITATHTARV